MARKSYKNADYRSAYVQGNAARKLKTESAAINIPLQTEEQLEEKRQRRKKEQQIRRANKMNLAYTIVVTAVLAVIFTICYQYLNLQATAKANATEVSKLKSQLMTMTDNNDEMEVDIKASINYDDIYNTAVNDLGMIYPNKSQVITYKSSESEYVKQYQDVPGAK